MAEAFRVDPQALTDAVQRMAAFQTYAEDMIAEIDSRVTRLHTSWTGDAAAAHAEAHQHWVRGEAMMREALAQLEKVATTRTATTPARCRRISVCGRDDVAPLACDPSARTLLVMMGVPNEQKDCW